MYFPLVKPHGWGKRSAVQPKTICLEIPNELPLTANGRPEFRAPVNFLYFHKSSQLEEIEILCLDRHFINAAQGFGVGLHL